MDILIKNATEEDYFDINKMLLNLQQYHAENAPKTYKKVNTFFSINKYKKIISNKKSYIMVADINSKIIGMIWFQLKEKKSKFENKRLQIWIEGIYVKENSRRIGVGKKLLNKVIENAKVLDATSIELMVWSFNKTAEKFFYKFLKKRATIMSLTL
jgi:Acetyltransferases